MRTIETRATPSTDYSTTTEGTQTSLQIKLKAKLTTLPKSSNIEYAVIMPTLGRFKTEDGSPGFVPRAIHSTLRTAKRDKLPINIFIGDGTKNLSDEERAALLSEINMIYNTPSSDNEDTPPAYDEDTPSPEYSPSIYILTPDTREKAVQELMRRLPEVDKEVIRAIITGTGYAEQRAHLDSVIGGMSLAHNTDIKALTIDDDIIFPEEYPMVRENAIHNFKRLPNSQIILETNEDHSSRPDLYEQVPNPSLRQLFEHLGKKFSQVRTERSGVRASKSLNDTMHEQLGVSIEEGAAQFVVTHSEEKLDAEDAIIFGASTTKFGKPDYRTVEVAKASLRDEFPNTEKSRISFPSGESELYAFQQCNTNIDSAVFSRLMNGETIYLPWWFVSSTDISRENPYGTVSGPYRADNELLPVLARVVAEQTGKQFIYLGGVATQAAHERAATGYRPNVVTEQAPASLVGNMAALESARRIKFDLSSGKPYIEDTEDNYEAPEKHSIRIFNEFITLAQICNSKIYKLTAEAKKETDSEENTSKITCYKETFKTLSKKTADWDYTKWKKALDTEIRDQVRFFSKVLEATPKIIEETKNMIQEGIYPVIEMVRQTETETPELTDSETIYTAMTSSTETISDSGTIFYQQY